MKKIKLFCIVIAAVMLLAACGEKAPDDNDYDEETDDISVTEIATEASKETDNNVTLAPETSSAETTSAKTEQPKNTQQPTQAPTQKPVATEAQPTEQPAEPTEDPSDPYALVQYDVMTNIDKIKVYGRYTVSAKDGVSCDYSASGIEFNANCKGNLTMIASTDTAGVVHETTYAYFGVWVDGVKQANPIKVSGKNKTVKIAENLSEGNHNIKLIKMTNIRQQRITIKTLNVNGSLLAAPAAAEHYIEFIGDSISCGHGLKSSVGSVEGTDATLTYAFLTAQQLASDHSFVTVDGIGLSKKVYVEVPMTTAYKYTSYWRNPSKEYAFERTPDIVVINLGTNDASAGVSATDFKAALKTFISDVRSAYKKTDLTVICIYNSMGRDVNKGYEPVYQELLKEIQNFHVIKADSNTKSDGHPNVAAHQATADKLVSYIKTNNLLK